MKPTFPRRALPLAASLLVAALGVSSLDGTAWAQGGLSPTSDLPVTPMPKLVPASPMDVMASTASDMDPAVRPQDDLYRHFNGAWLKTFEIPADKSNYGAFTKLDDDSEAEVRSLIEENARQPNAPGTDAGKVAALYNGFMDEGTIEARRLTPVEPLLAKAKGIATPQDMLDLIAEFDRMGISTPLGIFVHQDNRQATQYLADLGQSGLGLPDRDFYLLQDEKFAKLRVAYVDYITRLFLAAGQPDPSGAAGRIMALETRLATAQWDKVRNRDPVAGYNKMTVAQLDGLAPGLDWGQFVRTANIGNSPGVNVSQPSYVTALTKEMQTTPIATWREYFTMRALDGMSPLLPKQYDALHFGFHEATLNGVKEPRARWKRGVRFTQSMMGEAVGKQYVARFFPPESKARMQVLVGNLIEAYRQDIKTLTWMSPATKKAALVKLSRFTPKIGYPDHWRDYTRLDVVPGDLVGNSLRGASFEYDRNTAKLGQPIDRSEWGMTPQTVNAYYNPEMNEVVFPAAILRPPFFDINADDATNYGGIGAVIGHEISHGFDDQGSQYDGDGNLRMWWTPTDKKRFDALAGRLAAQYDTYEPIPGQHVNGKFTLGENIADLGGLTIANKAYHISLHGRPSPEIDGMSGEQRLFANWARVWKRKYREENLLTRLKTDPHSPSEYRANGTVVNLNSFHSAWKTQPGDKLYKAPADRIIIW